MTIGQFQWFVENQLTLKNAQTMSSEIGRRTYVCIDDLNLARADEGPTIPATLRQFVTHSGWFSQNKNRWLKFDACSVLANYTTHADNDDV